MHLKLALLLLLGATAAMAHPVEEDDGDDGFAVITTDDDDGDDLAEMEVTSCSRRSHKVYFDIGSRTYIFRYRACLDDATERMCYDSRETLPPFCPANFRGEDCIGIEWKVHQNTKSFDICDRFGKPCQQEIPGLSRGDSRGQCACAQGDIRLVGGLTSNQGRVEFCNRGVWGTVCDDSWGSSDARVVCRQLGFSTFGAVAVSNARFGRGTGPIWLDDVGCFGTESRLANCRARPIGSHNCGHHEDAGVRCRSRRDTFKIAEAMAGGAEDCLCVTKNGKKKCDGNNCRSE